MEIGFIVVGVLLTAVGAFAFWCAIQDAKEVIVEKIEDELPG